VSLAEIYGKASKFGWVVFLLCLPVTSFPYFPDFMMGSALVRPLSLYPLMALGILVTIPRLWTKPLPRTLIPFLLFGAIAIASTVFALGRGIDPDIDVAVKSRAISTLATLGIGVLFYLTVSIFPGNSDDLHLTLRWLYMGLAVALVWGTAQSVYILRFNQAYFDFFNKLQSYISIRPLVTFAKRAAGMAYEPSWFAEQLAFLYMPWLFSAVISKFTVFRWRWRGLTVELLLLGWSTGMLFLTFSRTGMFILILFVILAFLMWPRVKDRKVRKKWITGLKRATQVGLIVVVMGVIIFAIGSQNNYFARMWRYFLPDEETEGTYLYYIAFDQRFVYWETAYHIFEANPVLGIGLGNYAFYYNEYLPDRQYRNPEIYLPLVPEEGRSQIVTVKNMLLRILTETGILGAAAFIAFVIAVIGCVFYSYLSMNEEQRFWGRAGLFGLAAFVPVVFSIDSFAVPNLWVVFGLITASAHVFDQPS
jgi:O-antigen ligase